MPRRFRMISLWVGLLVVLGIVSYLTLIYTPTPPSVTPSQFSDQHGGLPSEAEFAELARTNPVTLLDVCLSRYTRESSGFRAVMEKQERMKGTLHPPEILKVAVREKPVAVSMRWVSGARPFLGIRTAGVAFVEGQDNDQMRSWQPDTPAFLRKDKVDPKGFFARDASRYCIKDAGFVPTMLRTRDAWADRQKAGELQFNYLGIRTSAKLGNRPCHVIERTCPHREVDSFARDEEAPADARRIEKEGFDSVTLFIDAEHWIQTGTELKRSNGDLVGAYYFRDLELDPKFDAQEFTLEGLKRTP